MLTMWHKRIGHVNLQKRKNMQVNNVVYVLPMFHEYNLHFACDVCQFGKQTRLPFKRDRYMSSQLVELAHINVWGLMRDASICGNKYYVNFIDDYSRKVWVYFMKNKSNVFYHFELLKNQV